MKCGFVLCTIVFVSCATWSARGEVYSFEVGSNYTYALKYGDKQSRLDCILTIACVSNTQAAVSSCSNQSSPRYSLDCSYKNFTFSHSDDADVQARLVRALNEISRFTYQAIVDEQGNLLKCNLNAAIEAVRLNKKESTQLILHNFLLPLIAGTWQCLVPRLPLTTGEFAASYDTRDWSVIQSPWIESYLRLSENNRRWNKTWNLNPSQGKPAGLVLWQQISDKRKSPEYGDDEEVVIEAHIEVRFASRMGKCIPQSGALRSKTTISPRENSGTSAFTGEMFFNAALQEKK